MVTITKLLVDTVNEKLIVSATSKGVTTDESNHTFHHKFTKIEIDITNTFVCKNEPSSVAMSFNIPVPEDSVTDYDWDLVDFEIPFSEILSNDVANDILFVWLTEEEYDENYTLQDNTEVGFGVTLSVNTFYDLLLEHIKINSTNCCKVNCSDVDFMLAWNGFNLAKTLQDYKQMIYYWKILHRQVSENIISCNCN